MNAQTIMGPRAAGSVTLMNYSLRILSARSGQHQHVDRRPTSNEVTESVGPRSASSR
jgi:hypothetical protein